MVAYHAVSDFLKDRRSGRSLDFCLDKLIVSPEVWKPYGDSPFCLIEDLREGDLVDTTSANWEALPIETKNKLMRDYQHWYVKKMAWPDTKLIVVSGARACPTPLTMRLIPPLKTKVSLFEHELAVQSSPPLKGGKAVELTTPFWMSAYQITYQQWVWTMDTRSGLPNPPMFWNLSNTAVHCPVSNICFLDAYEFSKHTKTFLPTLNLWEIAFRAGTSEKFFFSDTDDSLSDYAWYNENSGGAPQPVGKKKPNPFGLYDMLGNVWEWCISKRELKKPLVGGCYDTHLSTCGYVLSSQDEDNRSRYFGFRVCARV